MSVPPPPDEPPGIARPRLNVAFAYPEGELSGQWFRAYKALKRKLRRGGLNVRVQLLPLTELSAQVDVLVVPTELADDPPPAGAGETFFAAAASAEKELEPLVERLLADEGLRSGEPSPTSVVHQGFRPLTQRGRAED